MNQKRTSGKWIILLIVLAVLVAGGYYLWTGSFFGKRLPTFTGESIQAFTPLVTSVPVNATVEVALVTPVPQGTPIVLNTPTALPADVKPVCGQKQPMIVLGLGIDENEQADVIRIVRVDFIERRILILSIPRDFWVLIPGLSEYNITQFKINAAYGYGEYFLGQGQGVVQQSNTIYQNYGISFDRYVVFHFSNFERMIDAVGGVDIVLEEPIGAYGTAGLTHLDGKTALEYAQNRNNDNDLFRIKRQTEIIKSLYSKMIQTENILKIPGLGIEFLGDKSVLTDLSLQDVATFTCLAGEIDDLSLVFRDIPPELYQSARTNTGRFILVPSDQVAVYIQDLVINGNY
jgi:LCP family protein required for cell wall assembly